MKKLVGLALCLTLAICLLPKAYSTVFIDMQSSYTIPSYIEPNTTATLILSLKSTQLSSNVELTLRGTCWYVNGENEARMNLGDLYANEIRSIPVDLKAKDCEAGIYPLKIKIEYSDTTGHHEDIWYYPLTINYRPILMIKQSSTELVTGERKEVCAYLENVGKIDLRNIEIVVNSTPYVQVIGNNNFFFASLAPDKSQRFCIKVESDYPGRFSIPLLIKYETWDNPQLFDIKSLQIKVNARVPSISVKTTEITLAPGNLTNLTIYVENKGNTKIDNIFITLQEGGLPFFIMGDKIVKVNSLEIGEKRKIEIPVKAFENADAGEYAFPIYITFADNAGRSFNSTFLGVVKIEATPHLEINLDSFDTEEGKVTLTIINRGDATATGVLIELERCEGCVINKGVDFVGDVDKNDYETAELNIEPLGKRIKLYVKVYYKDAFNKENVMSKEISFSVEEKEEIPLLKFSGLGIILISAIILIKFGKRVIKSK